jgi:hypothetical protein
VKRRTFMDPVLLASTLGCFLILSPVLAVAADPGPALPPVLQSGFAAWTKGGPSFAMDVWQKGGLLDGSSKVAGQVSYFKRLDRALGDYKSWEWIETKKVGRSSQIIYLALNFERGAVYARFHFYLSDKNWVVQNMDFNTQPEALMPWLSLEAGKEAE